MQDEHPEPALMSGEWRKREATKIAAAVEELRKHSSVLADYLEGVDLKDVEAANTLIAHLRPIDVARMAMDIKLAADHMLRERAEPAASIRPAPRSEGVDPE